MGGTLSSSFEFRPRAQVKIHRLPFTTGVSAYTATSYRFTLARPPPAFMTEPPSALTAALVDRYRIERELGSGGMATVFLAQDLKHRRRVAIKVFAPEVAAAFGVGRFLREIEIAAHLQHPHILPLFDSGEAGGLLYYVMPFVEGESLADRLKRERQLPIDEVVRIAREVSLALAHAHTRSIIHRDIKPANILLSSDAALVADFGIARAMVEAGGDQLTSAGFSIGTPTYMSPEQSLGLPVDGRSDLYSLACVVYEMLTGEPPFTGSTSQALLARHSLDPVPRLRTLRATVPRTMELVIERALAKAPADRQSSVLDFATQLVKAAEGGGSPDRRDASGLKRGVLWAGAAVLLALAAVGGWSLLQSNRTAPAGPPKLAVLPFQSIGLPDDRYIADGMSDEITSRIAGMSGLVVIARSSSTPLAGPGRPLKDIGRELGVAYLLTGSVRTDRKADGTSAIRVTPRLVRAADEQVIWNEGYDLALAPGELLEAQASIADGVARALGVSLLLPEQAALAARPTDNLAAYEAYLRGNVYASQGYATEEPARQAVDMYQRAVDADPRFALAWARLSQAHTRYHYFDRAPSRLAQARTAANRAIALDSALPEAHLSLGLLHFLGYVDYDAAQREFEIARKGRPNDSEVLAYLATLARRRGHFEESVASLKRATELDPRSHLYAMELAISHLMMRRFPDAEREIDRGLALAPDYIPAHMLKSFIIWSGKGDLEKTRAAMREALRNHTMRDVLSVIVLRNPQFVLTLGSEFEDSLDAIGPRDLTIDPGFLYLAKGLSFKRRNPPRSIAYFDSARAIWEPRAAARPEEMTFHALLGLSYAGLGRETEALREGRTSVQLLPLAKDAQGGTYPLTMLVTSSLLLGQPDTALVYLRPLLEHPSNVSPGLVRYDSLFAPLRSRPGYRRLIP